MKNFLLIAFVVGMCDSCQGQNSERFRSFGKYDRKDARLEHKSFDLKPGDTLPVFELQPRIQL